MPKKTTKNNQLLEANAIEEGMILDYITNKPIKDTAKEQVRQRIVRALLHEYGISPSDMEADFLVPVEGRKRKVDIAIFNEGTDHDVGNIRRVVMCKPEPKQSKKSNYRMRSHEQADNDLKELKEIVASAPDCKYGLWTNGIELFFFQKKETRFDVIFEPIGDWPLADETLGTRDVYSEAHLRRADDMMLRLAFRRCHNFIHGNEGMPKDAAFWQFLYLIFAKMHDEKKNNGNRKFFAGPQEQFNEEGRKNIRTRIEQLFTAVKKEYPSIFKGNEEISLSDRALSFMVTELAKYDFTRSSVDAKGKAYQEIVGANLRGDRGQYFTPRGAIQLMVEFLDPKANEKVLDPACGTGGFLVTTIAHQLARFKEEIGNKSPEETAEGIRPKLAKYVEKQLYGSDFDQFLVRASHMNIMMAAGVDGNVFHMDSLAFPNSHLEGNARALKDIKLGTVDIVLTNPPFGADIPITDRTVLKQYELAHKWTKTKDGIFLKGTDLQTSVAPEILFIERCIQWIKPGGRMGIVLPNGILGNPGDEYIRQWILRNCWMLACVEVPVEAFIVEANVGILTSLLFLKKKTDDEIRAEALGKKKDYKIFMAVAEKCGFDRRGNTLFKRHPDGTEIVEEKEYEERVHTGQKWVTRTFKRKDKIVDDDFPEIIKAYKNFRAKNKEPGA